MFSIHYSEILKSAHPRRTVLPRRRLYGVQFRALLLCLLLFTFFGPCVRGESEGSSLSLSRPLTVNWRFETEDVLDIPPTAHDGTIILPLSNGNLVSLRSADGKLIWRTELGGEINTTPLIDGSGVYVATRPAEPSPEGPRQIPTGVLRALGPESGVTLWSVKLPSVLNGRLLGTENAVVGLSADGRLFAFRKDTGRALWVKRGEQPFTTSPMLIAGRIFAGSSDGSVFAFDQETGRTVWRYRTGGAVALPFSFSEQVVNLVSGNNNVLALSIRDGRLLWRRRINARVQSVVSTRQGVLVTALDNSVSLLSAGGGRRLWKQRMSGRVTAAPVTDEEAALFTFLSGEECVVLDLKTGRRLNAVYVGEDNSTSAAPLIHGSRLFMLTRKGLVVYTGSD